MTHADDVRDYVFEHYIRPARESGEKSVVVRVSDVHSALRCTNRLPLVCAALGAMKFRDKHRLVDRLLDRCFTVLMALVFGVMILLIFNTLWLR